MNSPVILVCTGIFGGLTPFLGHVGGFSYLSFFCPLTGRLLFGIAHGSWRLPFYPTMEPAEFLWIYIQSFNLQWYLGYNLYPLSPASKPSPKVFLGGAWRVRIAVCLGFPGVGFSSIPVPGRFLFGLREEKVAIREFAIILQPPRCVLVVFTLVLCCDYLGHSPFLIKTSNSAFHSFGLVGWQLWIKSKLESENGIRNRSDLFWRYN